MNPAASCGNKSPAPASAKVEAESDHHVDGEQRRPWADIATPLLDHLLLRVSLLDRARLYSVCRRWHDFLADNPTLRRPQFPWIIRLIDYVFKIFCHSKDRNCTLRLPTTYERKRCIAASHGWLFFNDYFKSQWGISIQGFLINPLTKVCIDLPASPWFYNQAALSSAPDEPGCIVMCLLSHYYVNWKIYHCRVGDQTWHVHVIQERLPQTISNITVMDGKFYLLCREGLAEMDINQSCPFRWINIKDDAFTRFLNAKVCYNPYLVESNGELLVVNLLQLDEYQFDHSEKSEKRDDFLACVFKADLKNKIWVRVENLQGRHLFLSKASYFSLPVPATDAREHAGGGCIYATTKWRQHDFGDLPWHEYKVYRGLLDQWPPHGYRESFCNCNNFWLMTTI